VTATKSLYSASPLSLFLNKFVHIKEDLWLVKTPRGFAHVVEALVLEFAPFKV
jgi:hypothetical protein